MNRKYIAIWDAAKQDYVWYNAARMRREREIREMLGQPEPETPPGCTETNYQPTGRFVKNQDGEQAEIFEAASPKTI